jgi:hypothetical protein
MTCLGDESLCGFNHSFAHFTLVSRLAIFEVSDCKTVFEVAIALVLKLAWDKLDALRFIILTRAMIGKGFRVL